MDPNADITSLQSQSTETPASVPYVPSDELQTDPPDSGFDILILYNYFRTRTTFQRPNDETESLQTRLQQKEKKLHEAELQIESILEENRKLNTIAESSRKSLQKYREKVRRQEFKLETAEEEMKSVLEESSELREIIESTRIMLLRQGVMRNEADEKLNITLLENRELVSKMAKLEALTCNLDDDTARQEMRKLIHSLEKWVKLHYNSVITNHSRSSHAAVPLSQQLRAIHEVQSHIAHQTFVQILSFHTVGTSHEGLDDYLNKADAKIKQDCPSHVAQHWRSAMSKAAFSLKSSDLANTCSQIAEMTEAKFPHSTSAGKLSRMEQLQDLLKKFVDFKVMLECQHESFIFHWFDPGTSVDEKHMSGPMDQESSNGVVKRCLCPLLYKIVSDGEAVIVEKAIVEMGDDVSDIDSPSDLHEIW